MKLSRTKLVIYSAYILLASLGAFTSCKKGSSSQPKQDVAYYSKEFLNDSAFAKYFKTVVTNSLKINKILGNDKFRISLRGSEDVVDSSEAYDKLAEIVTSQIMLQDAHPDFFKLTLEEQQQVCINVCLQLANETYRLQNPTNEMVIFGNGTIAYLNQNGPAMRINRMDISWDEFAMCTAGTLGAALGEYGGIVGEVWRMFTQGSKYLTWGGVFQLASRIVRNAVPWYKVASLAFGYATCLWAAA